MRALESSMAIVVAAFIMLGLPAQIRATEDQQAESASPSSAGLPIQLRESISRSQYEIVQDASNPEAFRANNPGQGLRANFDTEGIRVLINRSQVEWGMQLSGYGRVDHITPAASADIVVDRERIEYRRGGITEWYVNSQAGIEQGFTIHQRPAGHGNLVIDLRVSGGLQAKRVGPDFLFEGTGAHVDYANLHAFDATGRRLTSHMELVSSGESARAGDGLQLRLTVEDQSAQYPVIVDPIIGTETRIDPFDPEFGAVFAISVSISGDTAIAGSFADDPGGVGFLNSGSAYIYQRNVGGPDNWGLVQKITASDGASGDLYGVWVSISADTVIVGAFSDDAAAGAAYIYERNLGGVDNWGEVKKLTASDITAGDLFGVSVSIDSDTILVGARRNDDAGADSGSAYIFRRNEGGLDNWGEVTKILASDADADDNFGFSVSISGDTALVGAYSEGAIPGTSGAGAAYVYQKDSGGVDNWGEVQKLTASDAAPSDTFGWSVALSGDYALIGTPGNDDAGDSTGSAYLYQRNLGGVDNWGELIKLLASDLNFGENFGQSVAIDADTVVVGGLGDSDDGPFSGSAYLFQENFGGIGNWGEVIKLTASDAATQDDYGYSVGVSGDQLMIGAYNASPAAVVTAGSAYIYIDINSLNVPALSTDGLLAFALLMIAVVVAGIGRVRRAERNA